MMYNPWIAHESPRLRLISNGVHSSMGTVKILAHRKFSMLESYLLMMVALLTYHNDERLSQKNVSLLKILQTLIPLLQFSLWYLW